MKLLIVTVLLFLVFRSSGQECSFLVVGDTHYDLIGDHDMNWLSRKPDDLRQVTKEYTVNTQNNWADFMNVLKLKALTAAPPVKAIVQLGDLSEGLAGSKEKAKQMAANVMSAINRQNMPVRWIIAKGNHDITGPGAIEAFQEFYIPMFRKQTGNPEIKNASYSYQFDNVQITCVDPWDQETDMVAFLDQELSKSTAKFKFVAIHEPIVPVTERCWNIFGKEPARRDSLMEVIAKHKAIVLCGHLHRYSVVRRNTPAGPLVQVMVISVIKDKNYLKPQKMITEYGSSLAENKPDWHPETLEERKEILANEGKYVTCYRQTDLPGYAAITVNGKDNSIWLEYYAAFGKKPYDKVDLSKLLK